MAARPRLLTDSRRLEHEIEHGRRIRLDAESVWNWTSPAGQVRAQRRAELLVATARINSRDRALELGCGTGLFSGKVYNLSQASITAIDISEDLLDQAKAKHPDIDFQVGDAMSLNFPAGSFDVVFGSSVLHHLDMDKALEQIHRVLRTGGRMVFAEPNLLNPQIAIQKNIPLVKRLLGDSPDETAIIRWRFKRMMERTGFREVTIVPYDFLHPCVPKRLIGAVDRIGRVAERIPVVKEISGSVIIAGRK